MKGAGPSRPRASADAHVVLADMHPVGPDASATSTRSLMMSGTPNAASAA